MQKKKLFINAFQWLEMRWQFVLIPLLAITTILWMFVIGFSLPNFARASFYTLQFIVLNKDLYDPSLPISQLEVLFGLTIAQFLIPLVVSVAFFGSLFREQIDPFLIKKAINSLDGHSVVIGHGAIGQALSKQLCEEKKHVVVVDIKANIKSESSFLFHLKYDALSPSLFAAANLRNASQIYILLPDDRHNLKILESLSRQILEAKESLEEHPTIFVRAESSHMRKLFVDWIWQRNWLESLKLTKTKAPELEDACKKTNESTKCVKNETAITEWPDIRPINPYDVAARAIVNEYSPDLYAETDKSGDIAQTILIVGVSEMAKALILRFARVGIYSPQGKLRLIWAGRGVNAALAELADDYPSLKPDAQTIENWSLDSGASKDFVKLVISPLDIVAIDHPADQALRDRHIENACGRQFPSVVYVCHNSDIENAIEARNLQASLIARVSALRHSWAGQRLILAFQNQTAIGISQPDDIDGHSFFRYGIKDVCIDALFAKTVVDDCADNLAKKFDAAYSNLDPAKSTTLTQNKWKNSPFFLKETNRDPADHAAIKARYAGVKATVVSKCYFETKSTKDHSELLEDHSKLLENCKEKLERMEMRRYRAFMFLHGYNHGASSGDKNIDRALRINETLLDENLSSDHKKKDASIVQITLKALVPMLTFAKKPIPAKVSFALADGEMETLEGLVKFQKGDALNTGSLDEHWPISRATFESTYEPQGNFQMGLDGMYVKKFMQVNAVQVNCATTIELSQQRGALAAVVGDWVVTDPNGKQWVVANQIFRDTYVPI